YQSGNGYHDVPPPYTGTFMPPKPELVFTNAPNDVETVHTVFNVELSATKPDNNLSHTNRPSAPIIKDWVSDSEDESETKTPQNTAIPMPTSNGKRRNRKACLVCKSLDRLIKDYDYHEKKMVQPTARNYAKRGTHKQYAQMTLPNPQRHVVHAAVLTQSKLVPITSVRLVSTVVPKTSVTRPRQDKTIVTKPNSPLRRNINHSPSPIASNFLPKVTVVKTPMVNAAQGDQGKWEWKPKCLILDHGNPQHALKDKGVIDSGCSRHMTGNMSYLSDFEELNGGYVAFGGNPKGGKISGKGKIRTGKLDFDDVYFVKGLKFNLFSVSHMCDKKNSVLFTDTKCLVLSPEFKMPDENQVLLRATLDESNLCHRRLGHINFKTMNKLVKGKFDGKVNEGFLVGYYVSSKAFRVFNSRTRIVQETLHVNFLENKPNVAEKAGEKSDQQYVLFFVWSSGSTNPQNADGHAAFDEKEPQSKVNVSLSSSAQTKKHDDKTKREDKGKSPVESLTGYRNLSAEFEDFFDNSINEDNVVGTLVLAVGQISPNNTNTFSVTGPSNVDASPTQGKSLYVDSSQLLDDPNMPELEDITYSDDKDDVGAEADFNNLKTSITEELLQFKMQKVWVLVDLPHGKRAIGTKWVFRNKKDERDIIVRNKARLVAQGHTQEEGIDYEEFFTPVAGIEAIRLFSAYASFMGFMVYQMNVKSAFLYETIEEEVYVCQPPGFKDPDYPDKVYKVVNVLYGLHQAPRAWYETLANYLLENGFQRGKIDQTLFIKRQKAEILRKFRLTDGKSGSTLIDTEKPLLKDPDGEDVDVHTYRSMIGSLMYLTSSRPGIMFAVYACACFQVTPKASHLHAVKRIFRYLKGKPRLGLWYPKDSPFDFVAYSYSDYAGASLDKKSTTWECQFLGCRLIS
nr:hypothetical protein [Tanacetum cinerariifolium]